MSEKKCNPELQPQNITDIRVLCCRCTTAVWTCHDFTQWGDHLCIDDLSNKWIVKMDDGFNTIQLDEVNFIRRLLDWSSQLLIKTSQKDREPHAVGFVSQLANHFPSALLNGPANDINLTPLHFAHHLRDLGENYISLSKCVAIRFRPSTLLFCILSSRFRLCSKRWWQNCRQSGLGQCHDASNGCSAGGGISQKDWQFLRLPDPVRMGQTMG